MDFSVFSVSDSTYRVLKQHTVRGFRHFGAGNKYIGGLATNRQGSDRFTAIKTEFFSHGDIEMAEQSEIHDLEWAKQAKMAELYKECKNREIHVPKNPTKQRLVELIEADIIRLAREKAPKAEPKRARPKATTKAGKPPIETGTLEEEFAVIEAHDRNILKVFDSFRAGLEKFPRRAALNILLTAGIAAIEEATKAVVELLQRYKEGRITQDQVILDVTRLSVVYPLEAENKEELSQANPPPGGQEPEMTHKVEEDPKPRPDAGQDKGEGGVHVDPLPYKLRTEYPRDPKLARAAIRADCLDGVITTENADDLILITREEDLEIVRVLATTGAPPPPPTDDGGRRWRVPQLKPRSAYDDDPEVAIDEIRKDYEEGVISEENADRLVQEIRAEQIHIEPPPRRPQRPAPVPQPHNGHGHGNGDGNGLAWILGLAAIVAIAAIAIVASIFLMDDDNGSASSSANATSNGAGGGPGVGGGIPASGKDNGNLTSGNGGGVSDPQGTHFARLESLDPTYRSQGYLAWLSAAGVKCQAVVQARQPEEETSPSGKISVAGLQISATQCHVPWPNIVTTDTPSRVVSKDGNAVEYKPDPNNGSVLYTNVTVTGPVTVWIDGSNWGQFTSKLGKPGSAGAQPSVQPSAANEVKSIDDLKSFGTVIQPLSADGYLAGAQVRLHKDFTAPSGFVIQKGGAEVASASAGDTVSIWVPQALRVKQ